MVLCNIWFDDIGGGGNGIFSKLCYVEIGGCILCGGWIVVVVGF